MTPVERCLGKRMGSAPTVWLATDQTKTAVVYQALVRGLIPREVGVRRVNSGLRSHCKSAGSWVDQIVGQVEGFDVACDVLIIVQDWEGDRENPAANRERRELRRRITDLVRGRFGLCAPQVQFFLMPPTTEALYFLLAHLDFPCVRERLLRCDGVRERDITRIGRQRFAVAIDPHGEVVGPSRDALRRTLRLTDPRKNRLAGIFADAIERDLRDDGLRNGLRQSPAQCLAYLVSLASRLTP